MTNKQIANAFDELANLMELHGEDEFRIRSYRNAYLTLRKVDRPLAELDDTELKAIKGVGDAIAKKIRELVSTGKMPTLEKYREKTPPGVVEMLDVNGFGPKKVAVVWHDMGIETIGELWYACNENRLVEYKGFGLKTQEDLKQKLEYYLRSRDKLLLNAAEEEADFACTWLTGKLRGAFVAPVGEVRRRCPVVSRIEVLIGYNGPMDGVFDEQHFRLEKEDDNLFEVVLENGTPLTVHRCIQEEFGSKMFRFTGAQEFLDGFVHTFPKLNFKGLRTEHEVFEKAELPFIAPELREKAAIVQTAQAGQLPQLVAENDLRGVLHVHTTWSDGLHSLRDMAEYARSLGYDYIGITDHSQSAFYANGLKPDRVLQQMDEIDALNAELAPFRIFKGIESDILNDGELDYEPELLARVDLVNAPVHPNLKTSREKATARVLRAIENPHTRILGHPTGRLLLSREGYPLDWEAILDACARHQVVIELNANPHRLDLDWTMIPEATRRGIPVSINPDAHSKDGIHDTRYGVFAARKGGLTAAQCLNARGLEDFSAWILKK